MIVDRWPPKKLTPTAIVGATPETRQTLEEGVAAGAQNRRVIGYLIWSKMLNTGM